MTTPFNLRVVEDRSMKAILSREIVEEFWTFQSDLVELRPTAEAGRYQVLAGGKIGMMQSPSIKITVEPKIPGVNIRVMIDPESPIVESGGITDEPIELVLLDALATRLARLMIAHSERGLRSVYRAEFGRTPFLSGRWDIAAQLRDPLPAEFGFHTESGQLSAETPSNQFPKCVAEHLSTILPSHSHAFAEVQKALHCYSSISTTGFDPNSVSGVTAETQLKPSEREVFEFAQIVFNGFDFRSVHEEMRPTFRSLDLHAIFEKYVATSLRKFGEEFDFIIQPNLRLNKSESSSLAEIRIRPDLLIQVGGKTVGVLDTKWKRFDGRPAASDLQQIIAYLHVTSSNFGILTYPGDDDFEIDFPLDGGGELVFRQIRVTGTALECRESLEKLATSIRDRLRAFEE